MNKRYTYCIIIYSCILLLFVIFAEYKSELQKRIPTENLTIDEVEQIGGWWITVPAAENRFLQADINGTSFSDYPNEIFLIMPKETDETKVVFYIRDAAERFALRNVVDFSNGSVEIGSKRVTLIKTQLPVLYLKLDNEEYNNMVCDQFQEHNATGVFYSDNIESDVYVSPHGNASWWPQAKKSFNITLDKKYNLLGMSKNNKWNLISNYPDHTLLSNMVFLDLAEDIGLKYTCERKLATVYINESYKGVYMVTSKVSVNKNRVNLSDGDYFLNFADNDLENPTEDMNYFSVDCAFFRQDVAPRFSQFSVLYPKENVDMEFISSFVQEAYDALADGDSEDYQNYFDVDNLTRFYLFEEFIQNFDAEWNSIYLYYDHTTGKLMFGPVWDHDLALNADPRNPYTVYDRSWYRMFFMHESFINKVYEVYDHNAKDSVLKSIENYVGYYTDLQSDGELDNRLNKDDFRLLIDDYVERNYEEECIDRLDYYQERNAFLFDILDNHRFEKFDGKLE